MGANDIDTILLKCILYVYYMLNKYIHTLYADDSAFIETNISDL